MSYDEVKALKIGPLNAGGALIWFDLKAGPFKTVFVHFTNETMPTVESLSAEARNPVAYTDVVRDAYLKLGNPKMKNTYSNDLEWGLPSDTNITLGDGRLSIVSKSKKVVNAISIARTYSCQRV